MARIGERIDNVLEYLGLRPTSYYHSIKKITYDPTDPLACYLDPASKVNYRGPFDREGVPLYRYHKEPNYLPILICFFGLGHLEQYRRTGQEEHRSRFLTMADWLVARQDRSGRWLTPFPVKKFGLRKPYPSAIVQGAAISCLVRAFLLTEEDRFAESAVGALVPFQKDLRDGGITSYDGGRVFYEEYPAVPYHHVLNGFIYALWGLTDLVRVFDSSEARVLYEEGSKTLIEWLPRFDTGYWSLYHISEGAKNPATVNYHRLHVAQLDVMHTLTGLEVFQMYHRQWARYLGNRLNAIRSLPAKLWWLWTYRP